MLKKILRFLSHTAEPAGQEQINEVQNEPCTSEQNMLLKIYNVTRRDEDTYIDATIFYRDNSYVYFEIAPPGRELNKIKGSLTPREAELLKRAYMLLQAREWKSTCPPNCKHNWWFDFTLPNKRELTFPVHNETLQAPILAKKIIKLTDRIRNDHKKEK